MIKRNSMLSVLINLARRNRFPILAVFIIIMVVVFIVNVRAKEHHIKSAVTVETYCNSPHLVSGMETESATGLKLIQVQMLIRHGDRAPVDLKALPNTSPVHISCRFNSTNNEFQSLLQKYRNAIKNNHFQVQGSEETDLLAERTFCDAGQLTPFGFLQHLYLGWHLKQTFSTFVESLDVAKDVHVLSTDVPRTKRSAAALLTGMLDVKLKSNDVKIPINVHKDHIDAHLVLNKDEESMDCPALPETYRAYGPKFKAFQLNTKSVLENIAYYLSTDVSKLPAFNRIVDTFYTRACHNLGIPTGPKHHLPVSLIKQVYGFSHVYSTMRHSGKLSMLQALPLLSQIAKHIILILRTEDEGKKLVLYSGHDSMIHPFLQLLDEKFTDWPPYASRIVIEVYKVPTDSVHDKYIINKSYFRITYNGKPLHRIKFIGEGEGSLKLFPVSALIRYLTDNVRSFERYEPELLTEFVFQKIQTLCKV